MSFETENQKTRASYETYIAEIAENICFGNFFFCMVNRGGPTLLAFTGPWALLVQINFKTKSLSFWQEYSSNQCELAR